MHERGSGQDSISVGMQSYFAVRWLSPRLMRFIERHPGVGSRIEPLNDRAQLVASDVDVAIFWGNGGWTDIETELLFRCAAAPTASPSMARKVAEMGLETALDQVVDALGKVSGDRAYDRGRCHVAILARDATPTIPPRRRPSPGSAKDSPPPRTVRGALAGRIKTEGHTRGEPKEKLRSLFGANPQSGPLH